MLLCHSASAQGRTSRLRVAANASPEGVLEPWKSSEVACSESGLVDELLVRAGQTVRAGQQLAKLNSDTTQLQLQIARSQAESDGTENSIRADVELNVRKVNALQAARVRDHSSQLELERAQAELKVAQGRLLAHLEERDVLQLQVARLEQELKQRTIVAPINGVVVQLLKEVGEFVAPNSPEVVRIVDVSRLRAAFYLHVEEAAELARQTEVDVTLGDGTTHRAEIEHIAPVADNESGLVEVRVLIDNPEMKIHGSRCSLQLGPPRT